MLLNLENYRLILGSASPRRQEFMNQLNLPFEVVVKAVDESYPTHLKGKDITEHIAKKKSDAFELMDDKTIVITSDTLVCLDDIIYSKPNSIDEAKDMLKHFSGKTHQVITSICLKNQTKQIIDSGITEVTFENLSSDVINYYVENFKPFDKAGGYGIQEWIGLVGISKINGSYNTVVGLPTHLLYKILNKLTS